MYNEAKALVGKENLDELWRINEKYVDNVMENHRTFYFSHNPHDPININGTDMGKELNMLMQRFPIHTFSTSVNHLGYWEFIVL